MKNNFRIYAVLSVSFEQAGHAFKLGDRGETNIINEKAAIVAVKTFDKFKFWVYNVNV